MARFYEDYLHRFSDQKGKEKFFIVRFFVRVFKNSIPFFFFIPVSLDFFRHAVQKNPGLRRQSEDGAKKTIRGVRKKVFTGISVCYNEKS